ncbi:hypothetical protein ACAF60_21130 [Klebsiella aerogenes]|uniref:hypothetical protein n=1 Tax=Klebsiella aerogenes TaxID=548 RepID=UPI000A3CCFD1|nr:hypothetical protein [Klebsiella aerogenes]EKT8947672.1 hypothetical protein [Klebsiella aerogenes]EKV8598572.1 hypothetical protein [Klebsiella aerogenes]ELA0069590.1 hypothetical protein [Klebsiella aerogenes]OUE92552.1 hypothetical protein AZZ82_002672 [Klebsiella aerogenes]PYZ46342.1 hypothetical protein DNK66_10925 [Klebsiella aerogenes]
MISREQAIAIAKAYADTSGRGWDNRYHEAQPMMLDGEPVWWVATTDCEYSTELPWLMEQLPNPSHYYISMVSACCVAVGSRENDYQRVG